MEDNKYKLVLGSASPRRKELLAHLAIPFTVRSSNIEEVSSQTDPIDICMDLALQKAVEVFKNREHNNEFVIGSDTIVVLGERILGKPRDNQEARQMLLDLKNTTHFVYSGVAFVAENLEYTFYSQTSVTFDDIDERILEEYVNSGDSLDKAGAYGIQGQAMAFVTSIEGSYPGVVGLPVNKVLTHLKKCTDLKNWRSYFE